MKIPSKQLYSSTIHFLCLRSKCFPYHLFSQTTLIIFTEDDRVHMLNELVLPVLGVDIMMKLEGIIYFPTNVNKNTADT